MGSSIMSCLQFCLGVWAVAWNRWPHKGRTDGGRGGGCPLCYHLIFKATSLLGTSCLTARRPNKSLNLGVLFSNALTAMVEKQLTQLTISGTGWAKCPKCCIGPEGTTASDSSPLHWAHIACAQHQRGQGIKGASWHRWWSVQPIPLVVVQETSFRVCLNVA